MTDSASSSPSPAASSLRRQPLAWEATFAVLGVLAALPLWWVEHPPIQDLPQHLAAIRVLHDFGDPELGFSRFFQIHLTRTQYLTYYLLTNALAHPFGVFVANKLVFTLVIVATPYAMRRLLAALGRDERGALFVLPLTWNAHLLLGFVNFAAAIPLMLWGLALAVDLGRAWERRRAFWLAGVTLLAFYTHVVPFGFLIFGCVILALDRDREAMFRRWLPLIPGVAVAVVWLRLSAGGSAVLGALPSRGVRLGPKPEYDPPVLAVKQLGLWLTDVISGNVDLWTLWLVGLLATALVTVSTLREPGRWLPQGPVRRLALLVPLALVAYFVTPSGYDWIWPINGRFPLIAAIFVVPLLPRPAARFLPACYATVAAAAAVSFLNVTAAFGRTAAELGDVDAAVAAIPKGRKVVGLVWEHTSAHVQFHPYLHVVALYQAQRGGAVLYTFAERPQSPFEFRKDDRPPPVAPRWEWTPWEVNPRKDLEWFDYVLTRGDPGLMVTVPNMFERVYSGQRHEVWHRRGRP